MPPLTFLCRPTTWDSGIYRCVAELNEYRLPEEFAPGTVIVDVGGHIGSFSHTCLERGAGRVLCFEANRANYGLAVHNLAPWGQRAEVTHAAVWRSDGASAADLCWCGSTNPDNTGGGGVVGCEAGEPVPVVSLDEVLRAAGHVDLLKLDCEGSEWPILLTATELHRVEALCGEFHEIGGEFLPSEVPEPARVGGRDRYTVETLVECLGAAGFEVEWVRARDGHRNECHLGHFWARRPGAEVAEVLTETQEPTSEAAPEIALPAVEEVAPAVVADVMPEPESQPAQEPVATPTAEPTGEPGDGVS